MQITTKILILVLFLFSACTSKKAANADEKSIEIVKLSSYNVDKFSEKLSLPGSLQEISGLSLYNDDKLICVNDEEGKAFIVNANSGKIERRVKFGKSGDYEGVEFVNNRVYCIKSNGKLVSFLIDDEKGAYKKEEYDLPFSIKNDIEGLGVNQEENTLLIVAKGTSSIKGSKVQGKAIYGFDLKNNEFLEKPIMTISKAEFFNRTGHESFKASGIAYSPQQQCYYLIASAGKMIIKVNKSGYIEETQKIDSKILKQPEGIAFGKNERLYISSEGKGGNGYVLVFEKLKQ